MIRRQQHAMRRRLGARGTAVVEFGIVGSLLVLLVVGIADFALPLWYQQQVNNAARAGGVYAAAHGWTSPGTAVNTAGASATQLTTARGLAVTSSEACGCPNAGATTITVTGAVTSGACTSTCTAPTYGSIATAGLYVTVTATYTYTPLMPYANSLRNLTGTAIVRIK